MMNVPILNGPNWGIWFVLLQAAARIIDCWDVTKGEISSAVGASPTTYDRLEYPTMTVFPNTKDLAATKVAWNKKNGQALGLIQTMMALASVVTVWFRTISGLNQTIYITGPDQTNINQSKWSQSGCGLVMNGYEQSEP